MSAMAVESPKLALAAIEASAFPAQHKFKPERSYADWDLKLDKADELHVDVVLVTTKQEIDLQNRGGIVATSPVDVAIRKRFGAATQNDDTGRIEVAEIDGLMQLVEDLQLLFIGKRQSIGSVWRNSKILVAPITKHLRELHQFTAVIRIEFRATMKGGL